MAAFAPSASAAELAWMRARALSRSPMPTQARADLDDYILLPDCILPQLLRESPHLSDTAAMAVHHATLLLPLCARNIHACLGIQGHFHTHGLSAWGEA